MKKSKAFKLVFLLIGIVSALTAAATAFFIYSEKKRKDDEELEHYLDCSIQ